MRAIVRFMLEQLYTRFAWAYDAVAALASLGDWQAWGRCAISFLTGERLLEIAHGSGHLFCALRAAGQHVIAIDRSWPMAQQLRRRALRHGYRPAHAQADARHLPFPSAMFDSVVTTFPAPFVFETRTLAEVHRVLRVGGRWVIVPAVVWQGSAPMDRLLRVAHRISGRTSDNTTAMRRFTAAGFSCQTHIQPAGRAAVIIWVCVKLSPGPAA